MAEEGPTPRAADLPPVASAPAAAAACHRCLHCGESFASKNRLFAHLRASSCTLAAAAAGLEVADAQEKVALVIGCTRCDPSWRSALWEAVDVARGVLLTPPAAGEGSGPASRKAYAPQGAPGAAFASDARHVESQYQELDLVRVCDVLSLTTEVVHSEADRVAWCEKANAALPADIRILGRSPALPSDFHADASCLRRSYECLMPLRWLVPSLPRQLEGQSAADAAGFAAAGAGGGVSAAPSDSEADEGEGAVEGPAATGSGTAMVGKPCSALDRRGHVRRGQGDPRWGKAGEERDRCLAEFQRLKAALRRLQGEHRFHSIAARSRLSPSAAAARRNVFKCRAQADTSRGMGLIAVAVDALLAGQLHGMAGLAVAVQNRLLPDSFLDNALSAESLVRVPVLAAGTAYFAGCTYPKQFHYILQPLLEGLPAQEWRVRVQEQIIEHVRGDAMEQWYRDDLVPVASAITADAVASPLASGLKPAAGSGAPAVYEEVLKLLRAAETSGKWPGISKGREKVIKGSTLAENGGSGGSFTLGSMPAHLEPPAGNAIFPELAKFAFELERQLMPERPPSSTIAVNRHAQFLPHVDSGAGAGQGISLIVGLGDYSGGELVVEGTPHNIRYTPREFNGWAQRHWTLPFEGERFSLVWFTPRGCEDRRGLPASIQAALEQMPATIPPAPVDDSGDCVGRRATSISDVLELNVQSSVTESTAQEPQTLCFPRLGFGTYQLKGSDCEAAVLEALSAGYQLIDTASIYRNEESVGAAIREWELRGNHVMVLSKCSTYEMGFERALKACEASLQRLGRDAVDVYLIHWPALAKKKHDSREHRVARHATWRALEALHRDGRARIIGVSNFNVSHLEQLLEDGVEVVPMVNQIEVHPFFVPQEIIDFCTSRGIVVQAYSPLAGGPGSNAARATNGAADGTRLLLGHPAVVKLAAELRRTPAQVVLRWALQRGFAIVPRSSNAQRIAENARLFDFSLSAEQMSELGALRLHADAQKFCWDSGSVS